jgi:hypothetical protein
MLFEQVASDPMADIAQPTERQVERFARRMQKERDWTKLLLGLARLTLAEDEGVTYSLSHRQARRRTTRARWCGRARRAPRTRLAC